MTINKSWINPANLPAPTQANYPCLFHSFSAAGISANGQTITDPIGGVTIGVTSGFVKSGNGFYQVAPVAGASQTGVWATPGNKSILVIATGSLGPSLSFSYGDSNGITSVPTQGNTSGAASKDAADYAYFSAITGSPYLAIATAVNVAGGTCETFALPTAPSIPPAISVGTTTVTGSIVGPWPTPSAVATPTSQIFTHTAFITGAFVLLFNTLPSNAEIEGIVAWMAANPLNLPPSLLGRT